MNENIKIIEDKEQLMEWFESGLKKKRDWMVGTEHEKFAYTFSKTKNKYIPLSYEGKKGINIFLRELTKFGWEPICEENNIIALKKNLQSITLEPGGQIELSGAPLKNLHSTCKETNEHLKLVKDLGQKLGILLVGLGVRPNESFEEVPLMPKATAVWLLDNTVLTFEQIADFCNLHLLEVKGIADGDVAKGIRGADPIAAGQLTRAEIESCQEDPEKKLHGIEKKEDLPKAERRVGKKYTPLSKRQDRPDAIFWLVRNHPELLDAQISRLIGTTKNTIQSIRDRTHWNSAYLNPVDPVSIGICTQIDLDKEVQKASKRIENRKKKEEKEQLESTTLSEIDETNELAEALDTNNEEKSNELDEAENKETELDLNKDEPTISEENKEYDSDSVFAKLQELKKD